jgi:hypothetical protein
MECAEEDIVESFVTREMQTRNKATFTASNDCFSGSYKDLKPEQFPAIQKCLNATECDNNSTKPGTCTKECGDSYWAYRIDRKYEKGKGPTTRAYIHVSEDHFCDLAVKGQWPFPYGCVRGELLHPSALQMRKDSKIVEIDLNVRALKACSGPFYRQDCAGTCKASNVPISAPQGAILGGDVLEGEKNIVTGKSVRIIAVHRCPLDSVRPLADEIARQFAKDWHDVDGNVTGISCIGATSDVTLNGKQPFTVATVSWVRYCAQKEKPDVPLSPPVRPRPPARDGSPKGRRGRKVRKGHSGKKARRGKRGYEHGKKG